MLYRHREHVRAMVDFEDFNPMTPEEFPNVRVRQSSKMPIFISRKTAVPIVRWLKASRNNVVKPLDRKAIGARRGQHRQQGVCRSPLQT
jgi:hypothetical protein